MSLERKPSIRTEDDEIALHYKQSMHLVQSTLFILNVFEYFVQQDPIECFVREGHLLRGSDGKRNGGDVGPARPRRFDPLRNDVSTNYLGSSTTNEGGSVVALGAAAVEPGRPSDQTKPIELAKPIIHHSTVSSGVARVPIDRPNHVLPHAIIEQQSGAVVNPTRGGEPTSRREADPRTPQPPASL